MTIQLYGLLHLCKDESSVVNVSVNSFQDQIEIYLKCAVNLSNSLKSRGISFTLLTNDKATVEDILRSGQKIMPILEIPFYTTVPQGTKFYSSHFKFDVFRYLSSLSADYVGFCDLDVVCINDFPSSFANIVKQKIPLFYDVSDQVIPARGQEVIIHDLEAIHSLKSEGRWSGGEFISGSPEFFMTLSQTIDSLYEKYINVMHSLHHIGDESVTSAALEVMRRKGVYIADAGTLGIIGRFWSRKTLHYQKPFDYFQQCFLLHLPYDKRFLANMVDKKLMFANEFGKEYMNYKKLLPIKYKIKRLLKRVFPKSASNPT